MLIKFFLFEWTLFLNSNSFLLFLNFSKCMFEDEVDHPWGLKRHCYFRLTSKKFPVSNQVIYPLMERCAGKDLGEVVTQPDFSSFQADVYFTVIPSTSSWWALCLTRSAWWFVAFVEQTISSLVRLWSSMLRLESLIFQTDYWKSPKTPSGQSLFAQWGCLCPFLSLCTFIQNHGDKWVGTESEVGMGTGGGSKRKVSPQFRVSSQFQVHPVARREEGTQLKFK